MVSESRLKRRAFVAILQKWPDACIMSIEDMFHVGYPDWLIILRGRHVFVEWKKPDKKLRPMQKYYRDKIISAGGEAYKCDSTEDVLKILERR